MREKYRNPAPKIGGPWQNLCGAIIASTINDLVTGTQAQRRDARKAMLDPYFDRLCLQGCNLEADYLRQKFAAYLETAKKQA